MFSDVVPQEEKPGDGSLGSPPVDFPLILSEICRRDDMLKRTTFSLIAFLLVASVLQASKEEKDAKKLDKELKKISLTAAVLDGRRVVNRVMAQQLSVSRKQLVNERRKTGFVYGQLFGAHEVGQLGGMKFDQVAQLMNGGHSLLELSDQHNVDLKQILADAKSLNKKIDRELNRVANGEEDEQADDSADSYDPSDDSLTADTSGFTPAQVAQANNQVRSRGAAFGQGGPAGQGRTGGMGSERGLGGGIGAGASGGGRGRH